MMTSFFVRWTLQLLTELHVLSDASYLPVSSHIMGVSALEWYLFEIIGSYGGFFVLCFSFRF